jgi:dephospho-CoA kinase
MRRRIVEDADARRTLEAITHPAIRTHLAEELQALAAQGHAAAVVEAALLVETGSYRDYPVLIVVTCTPETQLRRLIERDHLPPDQAKALLQAQLPLADKEAVATHVVRNDGTRAELEARVREVWGLVRP